MHLDDSPTHHGRSRIHKLDLLAHSLLELHYLIDAAVMAATSGAEVNSSNAYPVDAYAAYDPLPEGAIRLIV